LILNILIFDSKIRDKGDGWRRRIQLWYTAITLVNVTMYPQYNNKNLRNVKYKNI
jgi:hypothetical protein